MCGKPPRPPWYLDLFRSELDSQPPGGYLMSQIWWRAPSRRVQSAEGSTCGYVQPYVCTVSVHVHSATVRLHLSRLFACVGWPALPTRGNWTVFPKALPFEKANLPGTRRRVSGGFFLASISPRHVLSLPLGGFLLWRAWELLKFPSL